MKILKLQASQRVAGRILIQWEDGSILRVTQNEIVEFGLYAGLDCSEEQKVALEAAIQQTQLQGKALNYAAGRPISRKELLQKLLRQGYEAAMCEPVLDRLEELGYLDDLTYAKTVVQYYQEKGYGRYKIRGELARRGVPREAWNEALGELDDTTAAIDRFLEVRLLSSEPKQVKKASDALARRGFDWEEVAAGIRRRLETLDETGGEA